MLVFEELCDDADSYIQGSYCLFTHEGASVWGLPRLMEVQYIPGPPITPPGVQQTTCAVCV